MTDETPNTDLQEQIVELATENPELSNKRIAEVLDTNDTYVGRIRKRFGCESQWTSVQESDGNPVLLTDGGEDEELLTDLQERIITVARNNPGMTNPEIANRVDASESYVSKTRSRFGYSVTQQGEDPETIQFDIDASDFDDEEPDVEPAVQYESRNERIQETIDVLAANPDYDEYGRKAELAREYDLEDHRIGYVLDRYEHLVDWRRNADLDPLSPEAVKEAYDDEHLAAMVGDEPVAVSDGGQGTVTIEFQLDEAFRAMKLLPGDLGMKVFTQVITDVRGMQDSGLDALFENR